MNLNPWLIKLSTVGLMSITLASATTTAHAQTSISSLGCVPVSPSEVRQDPEEGQVYLADGVTSATLYCPMPVVPVPYFGGDDLFFELIYSDLDGTDDEFSITAELFCVEDFAEESRLLARLSSNSQLDTDEENISTMIRGSINISQDTCYGKVVVQDRSGGGNGKRAVFRGLRLQYGFS